MNRHSRILGGVALALFLGAFETLGEQELRPLSLASADFDGDGVPDLAAGFATADGGGLVVLYRGNADALYPHSPEARQRRTQGVFVGSPFLSTNRVLALSAPPDFLSAGDFDADGRADLAAASRSGVLIVAPGDGELGFREPVRRQAAARIDALAAGDVGRRDGLADLVLSGDDGAGPRALIFRGAEGALRAVPESVALEEPAESLTIEPAGPRGQVRLGTGSGAVRILERSDRSWNVVAPPEESEAPSKSEIASPAPEGSAASLAMRVGPNAGGRVVLLADGSLSIAAPAVVSTFVVNSTADTSDAAPGDGVCAAAGGECSLRAAIQEANAHAGADAISFAIPGSGVPQISILGLPIVTETITIDGTTQPAGRVMITGTSNGTLITLGADDCVLRGIVLNGTGNNGLKIQASGSVVEGNFFGTTADGTATQGGIFGPNVYIFSGTDNLIGGTTAAARNVIAGGSSGIFINSGPTTVQGNYVGTDVTGTVDLGSGTQGVRVFAGDGNTIGGAAAGAGNLVSGEGQAGISLETNGNVVQGNRVGTDASGTAPIPNGAYGVHDYFAVDNTIGGTAAGAGNLISGNSMGGVRLDASGVNPITNTIVQGNRIGTNVDGTAAIPNNGYGIHVVAGTNVQIGGASAGAGNLISGNLWSGIYVEKFATVYTTNLHVQGNSIGTDATGTVAIPNLHSGIEFLYAYGTLVGGTAAGEANLISGNHDHGIFFDSGLDASSNPNRVLGNLIGTNAFGTGPLANGGDGVHFALSVRGWDAGGDGAGEPNLIADNGGAGLASDSGRSIRYFRNVIHSNGGLGVDRGSDGVTPNQAPGTFVFENFPVLTDVSTSGSGTTVSGTLSSGYALAYTLRVFANTTCDSSGYGEARTYLGSVPVNTTAGAATPFSTNFPTPLPAGSYVSALAVAPDDASYHGGSSELSFCRQVSGGAPPESLPLQVLAVAPGRGGNGGNVTVTVTGQGIVAGAAVTLKRAGHADIGGTSVSVDPSGAFVTAVFPLSGAAVGAWDVVVTNPGPASATLSDAFLVETASEPDVWADILGRGTLVVRGGREQTFFLVFGNRGNVDSSPTELRVTIPRQLRVTSVEDFDGSQPVVSLDVPETTGGTGQSTIQVFTRSIPAQSSRTVAFRLLTIEAEPGEFGQEVQVDVWALTSDLLSHITDATTDPSVTLSTTVIADTPEHLEWSLHVASDTASGDVHYDVTVTEGTFEVEPVFTRTDTPTETRYEFTGAFATGVGAGPGLGDGVLSPGRSKLGGSGIGGGISKIGGVIKFPPEFTDQILEAIKASPQMGQSAMNAGEIQSLLEEFTQSMPPDQIARILTQKDGQSLLDAGTKGPLGGLMNNVKPDKVQTFFKNARRDFCTSVRDDPEAFAEQIGITVDEVNAKSCDDLFNDLIHHMCRCPIPPPLPFAATTACKAPRIHRVHRPLRVYLAIDPNEKAGPGGSGPEHYVNGETPLSYTVTFENVETASASAQEVVVTDQIDGTKLDLSTFELGPITFGENVVDVPPGRTSFSNDVDLRPGTDLIVRVAAALNPTTGVATWHFFSIDPATGQPTTNPILGFLPPNVDSPRGEGHVSFAIRAKTGQASGTPIHNQASIVFDANAPIVTADWSNTLDVTPPSSQVAALPGSACSGIAVQWVGTDAHSGIARYDVWVSENGGAYFPWKGDTTTTSAIFYGEMGSTYAFYSVARDAAGNVEAPPASADATATVDSPTPLVDQLDPSSGPATGAPVTLTGSGFESGAAVLVGGQAAGGVVVNGAASMDALFPALAPGALYDVTAANASACAGALAKGWFADFSDVPQAHQFHDFVEAIMRHGITAGCASPGNYCPANAVTRAQMAVFLIKAKYNLALTPPPATGTVFADVLAGNPFSPWIEQLAGEGITGGCGGNNYCPGNPVTREQMAVFLLKSKYGALHVPPPATGLFADVPVSSPFASWIEELAAEGITGGCGGPNYCPGNPVTRGQMAVFLAKTFGFGQ